MDSPAPPPDQVRPTPVGGGEIPVSNTMKNTENQSPSKGMKNNENNETNATLTEHKGGSIRLIYSTKNHTEYKSDSERQWAQPTPKDFDMFGLLRSEWQRLLSCDTTIQAALTYDIETEAELRQYKLNQVRKSEMMYALRNRIVEARIESSKLSVEQRYETERKNEWQA